MNHTQFGLNFIKNVTFYWNINKNFIQRRTQDKKKREKKTEKRNQGPPSKHTKLTFQIVRF